MLHSEALLFAFKLTANTVCVSSLALQPDLDDSNDSNVGLHRYYTSKAARFFENTLTRRLFPYGLTSYLNSRMGTPIFRGTELGTLNFISTAVKTQILRFAFHIHVISVVCFV